MFAARLWPNVAPAVRSALVGRTEIVHTVLTHSNPQVVGHTSQPWGMFITAQQSRQSSVAGVPVSLVNDLHNKQPFVHRQFCLPLTTSAINLASELGKLSENDHAHQVMRSLPAYTFTTVSFEDIESHLPPVDVTTSPPPLPNVNWNLISPEGVAGSFIALSRECKVRKLYLNANEHQTLCQSLCKSIPHLSNEQLKDVLAALTLWSVNSSSTSVNFVNLWNALDVECVKRVRKWDLHQCFVVAELWFALGLSRPGTYTIAMLTQLSLNIDKMEAHHIVQYMFFMNLCREQPKLKFALLEKRLCEVMDSLTLEELGVIAMGLFKAQAFIRSDELTAAFFNRMLSSDISHVSSISLCSIFKILRRCPQTGHIDKMYQLLTSMVSRLSGLSLQAQLQVALLGNDMLIFKPELISQIAVNFAEQTSDLRLKDIERLVLVLMMYNFIPAERPDILQEFAEELRKETRHKEIGRYPKSFLSCVNYMATLGYLPLDLVSTALQPELVKSLQKTSYVDIGREVLELDIILDMDAPKDYIGGRLKPDLKNHLLATYFDRCLLPRDALNSGSLTHNNRFILDVERIASSLLGGLDKLATVYVLPYTSSSADVVFCLNSQQEPVDVPEEFLDLPHRSIKRPLQECPRTREPLHWVAMVPAGRNSLIRGSNRPRGQLEMKMRHLRKLGYQVVMVPISGFQKRSRRRKLMAIDELLVRAQVLPEDEERLLVANKVLTAMDDDKQDVELGQIR